MPPDNWEIIRKELPNEFPLTNAITQKVTTVANGISMIERIDQDVINASDFKELAMKSNNEDSQNVEDQYWSFVRKPKKICPLYSIDNDITLFDDQTTVWNFSKIEKTDSMIHEAANDVSIPGVLTPYVYIGTKNSAFGWHVEDDFLASMNILHFGYGKYWYVIPPSERRKFEEFTQKNTTRYTCDLLVRHKYLIISPSILKENGIKFGKVSFFIFYSFIEYNLTVFFIPLQPLFQIAQNPNEIIITFPKGYHAGFNSGYNIAEAVNVATPNWLNIYSEFNFCNCG